ncbi:hypothetical protein [Acidovorax sp. NB1]|uniref:hypothetical protein n=1 Tax=Acidovorax sp. NB1 TaxID=1943571 RepID=UPI0010EDA844|nr:hypothetical protein [Acidovorax sp. NB1]GDY37725.1 hypothetical protein ACINB_36170 [Acidovorax sp. NB1]
MKRIFAVLAIAMPFAASAQAWKQEPDSVLGIALGQPLSNDAIKSCGGVQVQQDADPIQACATKKPQFGDGAILLGGIPIEAFTYGAVVREIGVVSQIGLMGPNDRYEEVKRILVERYGKPAKIGKITVQNKLGASFDSEQLSWRGKTVSLVLDQRAGTVEEFAAVFTHLPTAAKAGGATDTKAKRDAQKL